MRQSPFDRWLTTEPEYPPDGFEVELSHHEPDPCPVCDWVGCHEEDCPEN